MKRALVVGSGAGGATVAKELQGHFDVTVLEAGRAFRPLAWSVPLLESLRKTGLLFDERAIRLAFRPMQIRKTPDMVLVNGIAVGGTTTICTGNAVRKDGHLKSIGIDLDAEFEEIAREIPTSTSHQERWRESTRRLNEICQEMGLDPRPTPKMGHLDRCARCGRCVLGCPRGAKWDSRQSLDKALERGARLITGCRVERVVVESGRATGVVARQGWRRRFYPADLVVLAAGGFGTPVVLQNSGFAVEPGLFVDPVLCVAGPWPGVRQYQEIPMPFIVQREHYILSPYFDYLSFFFNREWRRPAGDIVSMMIKLADERAGHVSRKRVVKPLISRDKERLREGVETCREILQRFGIERRRIFLGTINAGHPGGTLPLTEREAASLHHDRLPANLFVADATLIPKALGNPAILTIVALAKRVSKICVGELAGGR